MRSLHGVFSELAFDIHHVIGKGDLVAVHCALTGRRAGTLIGPRPPACRRHPVIHILGFRNGMAAEHWAVPDDTVVMRQLGVLPTHAPRRAADDG